MNERIKQLRLALGLSQEAFGMRLGLGRGAITNIELGKVPPKPLLVGLICREFGCREEWLRTGKGEMLANISRQKKIAAFLNDLLREDDDSFRVNMIDALSDLAPDEWQMLEKFAQRLVSRKPAANPTSAHEPVGAPSPEQPEAEPEPEPDYRSMPFAAYGEVPEEYSDAQKADIEMFNRMVAARERKKGKL